MSSLSPLSELLTGRALGLMALIICVLGSSLTLVYTKHQSRKLHIALQQLQQSKDSLHIEWTRLLLEQGTLSSDVRVESIAREKLGMMIPASRDIMVIKP